MKHAHIGLVALAAMAIAGCGGGSSKTSTNGDMPEMMEKEAEPPKVNLNGVTGFRLGEDGTVTIPLEAGTREGPDESMITCVGEDGCVLVVTQDALGVYSAVSMRGTVTVMAKPEPEEPKAPPADPTDMAGNDDDDEDDDDPPVQGPMGVPESQVKERVNTARDQGVLTGLAQAELEDRAEKLLPILSSDFTDAGRIEAGVTVKHMRGDSRVKPVPSYDSGLNAPSIDNFTGAGFTRTPGDFRDRIYLYTNIQSPGTRPFWKIYGATVAEDDSNFDFIDENDGNKLKDAVVSSTAKPRFLNDGKAVTDTKGPNDADPDDEFDSIEIIGSFKGFSGTFICEADNCGGDDAFDSSIVDSIVSLSGEEWTFPGGDWIFKPSSVNAPVQSKQDDEYLYFGIWAREPKDKDGSPDFKWIAGGGAEGPDNESPEDVLGNFSMLEGSAKFVGGAVGQYAIDKTSSGGPADVGIFTADATFDATFDVQGTANDNQISGRITNFEKEDGSSLKGTLYLGGSGSGNPPAPLVQTGVAATAIVSGTIDGVDVTGNWAARLYGVDNHSDAPEGLRCSNGCAADVAGVTGWFNAGDGANAGDITASDVVAIGGAFGAAKQ